MIDWIVLVSWPGIRRGAKVAISLLSAQEGVTELVVVVEPALTALIDGGLADVVVLIKVAGPSLIADPGLFVDIVHSLAGRTMS